MAEAWATAAAVLVVAWVAAIWAAWLWAATWAGCAPAARGWVGDHSRRLGSIGASTVDGQPSIARGSRVEVSMPDVASLAGAWPSITVTADFGATVASSRSWRGRGPVGLGRWLLRRRELLFELPRGGLRSGLLQRECLQLLLLRTSPVVSWAASAALFCCLHRCSCAVKENFRKVRLNGPKPLSATVSKAQSP